MLILATALYKGLRMCYKVLTLKKGDSLHFAVCCMYHVLAVVMSLKKNKDTLLITHVTNRSRELTDN